MGNHSSAGGEERIMVFINLGFAALIMLSILHSGQSAASELAILNHPDDKVVEDGMVDQVGDLETAPSHGYYGGYGHGYGGYGHGGYGHGYSYGHHGYGYGGHGYGYGHHGYGHGDGGYGHGYG